ncbi:helix-turn-helix domain-containing protein [Bradyrhizobium sp. CCBAU 11434]|uniref:helix-turn-helix domain-containing protein n=1 Tax=Bradyrhizobium sp. CCBAU 11434 TaxID=1630885 RepID=UPI002FE41660
MDTFEQLSRSRRSRAAIKHPPTLSDVSRQEPRALDITRTKTSNDRGAGECSAWTFECAIDVVSVHNAHATSLCLVYRGAVYRATGILSCMDLRETFATNLRRLRNARRWSQDELALEAKISRSYLSQLEKGAYYVSIKIIGRLADKLDVEPAEFLKRPTKRVR